MIINNGDQDISALNVRRTKGLIDCPSLCGMAIKKNSAMPYFC